MARTNDSTIPARRQEPVTFAIDEEVMIVAPGDFKYRRGYVRARDLEWHEYAVELYTQDGTDEYRFHWNELMAVS